MKFLDRLALKIFSLIIFVIVVAMILLFIGVISINDIVMDLIRFTDGPHSIEIIFGILGVLMIFAIKGLFFTSKPESKGKEGIILENASGKLVISKESLENLIASVTKEIPGAETVASRTIVDKNKNLIVYVTAIVSKDVMIKDVSNQLQERVKEAMKKTADLEVKEVNIKIKNKTKKKVKGLPSPAVEETQPEETEVNQEENNETSEE